MNSFLAKYHKIVFYFSWFLINLVQASLTGLFDDEAYYWIYAQFPEWGYFDHPPMIAWLIIAGGWFFDGEAGLRFFIVLLNTGTLFLIHQMLLKKNDRLFYLIAFSLVVAQIGGIIAVPDLPLLFFIALFFYQYQFFDNNPSIKNSLLLGITVALMMYSKYHGVLIVLCTVLSNPKLLARYQTYVVIVVSLLLFSPHLYWQYTHDFPSVQYHLFERSAPKYQFSFTTEYIAGQLLLAGPIAGWLLLYAAFKYIPGSALERALKFSLVGIYGFFLLSTFKGRVEANWTIPAFVALIVLSHQYLLTKPRLQNILLKTLPLSLILVVAGRVYMMADIEPLKLIKKDEFHQNKEWTQEIQDSAKGANVVFLSSYQKPSKYWFYTGEKSFSMNNPSYRRNNFNYWPLEDSLFNKPAFVVAGLDSTLFTIPFHHVTIRENGGTHVNNYYSFSKIRFEDVFVNPTKQEISMSAQVPASYLQRIQQFPMDTATIYLAIVVENEPVIHHSTGIKLRALQSQNSNIRFPIPAGIRPGSYPAKMVISTCLPGQTSLNSTGFRLSF